MGGPVRHSLDWWHLSDAGTRRRAGTGRHQGPAANAPAGLDFVSVDVERLRHLIWNGYAAKAGQSLWGLNHLASGAIYFNRTTARLE